MSPQLRSRIVSEPTPCATAATLLWLTAALTAQQPEAPLHRQDPALLRRIEALEQELTRLRDDTTHTTPDRANTSAQARAPSQAESHYPNVHVTGFFHIDAGYYMQNDTSIATLGDIDDGLGFRRARLAAAGEVADGISFIMEFDAAQAQARFVDTWMQFDETPVGKLRIGRFRQPFGMDEMTSVRELPFLERASQLALAPFRQTGLQVSDTVFDQRATYDFPLSIHQR